MYPPPSTSILLLTLSTLIPIATPLTIPGLQPRQQANCASDAPMPVAAANQLKSQLSVAGSGTPCCVANSFSQCGSATTVPGTNPINVYILYIVTTDPLDQMMGKCIDDAMLAKYADSLIGSCASSSGMVGGTIAVTEVPGLEVRL